MNGKQKTFAVALSRDMAPTAHIVAYCIVEGEVVTDALSFYVRDIQLTQVRLAVCPFFSRFCAPSAHVVYILYPLYYYYHPF